MLSISELEVLASYADTSKYFNYTKAYLLLGILTRKTLTIKNCTCITSTRSSEIFRKNIQAASPSMQETTEMLANADTNPAEVCVIYNFTS